jgi:hypothetical protein
MAAVVVVAEAAGMEAALRREAVPDPAPARATGHYLMVAAGESLPMGRPRRRAAAAAMAIMPRGTCRN